MDLQTESYKLQALLLKLAFTRSNTQVEAAGLLGMNVTTLAEKKKALMRKGFDPLPDGRGSYEIYSEIMSMISLDLNVETVDDVVDGVHLRQR